MSRRPKSPIRRLCRVGDGGMARGSIIAITGTWAVRCSSETRSVRIARMRRHIERPRRSRRPRQSPPRSRSLALDVGRSTAVRSEPLAGCRVYARDHRGPAARPSEPLSGGGRNMASQDISMGFGTHRRRARSRGPALRAASATAAFPRLVPSNPATIVRMVPSRSPHDKDPRARMLGPAPAPMVWPVHRWRLAAVIYAKAQLVILTSAHRSSVHQWLSRRHRHGQSVWQRYDKGPVTCACDDGSDRQPVRRCHRSHGRAVAGAAEVLR